MTKYVYMFSEGEASMKNLLGGKGANLAEMANLGLPVPQGFTVTTEACTLYNASNHTLSDEIKQALLGGEGVCGALYHLILCYERADWAGMTRYAEQLAINQKLKGYGLYPTNERLFMLAYMED